MQREEWIARARDAAREQAPQLAREREAHEAVVRDRLAAADPTKPNDSSARPREHKTPDSSDLTRLPLSGEKPWR